jgi:hypothetical protein
LATIGQFWFFLQFNLSLWKYSMYSLATISNGVYGKNTHFCTCSNS